MATHPGIADRLHEGDAALPAELLDDVDVAAAADEDFAEPLDSDELDDYTRGEAAEVVREFRARCSAGERAALGATAWDGRAVHEMQAYLGRRIEEQSPGEQHYTARERVIQRVDSLVRDGLAQFKGLHVDHYGSYTSRLFTPNGDLDISIEGQLQLREASSRRPVQKLAGSEGKLVCELGKEQKAALLRELGNKLKAKQVIAEGRVDFILHARVPIIKFVEAASGIPCDMAVGSGGARFKSTVLRHLSGVDGRFADLLRLVKLWAKAFHMNDASNGTFNTFALTLMVVFHLQTRQPPVLPPICELFGLPPEATAKRPLHAGREADLSLLEASEQCAAAWQGGGNGESVLQLLHSFFALYSSAIGIWTPTQSIRAVRCSTWVGDWYHRPWTRNYIVPVEDPFDVTDNCARSIFAANVGYVRDCFTAGQLALQRLQPGAGLEAAITGLFSQRERPNIRHPFTPRGGPRVGWNEAGWGRNSNSNAAGGGGKGGRDRQQERGRNSWRAEAAEPSNGTQAGQGVAALAQQLQQQHLEPPPPLPPPGVRIPAPPAGPPPGFSMGSLPLPMHSLAPAGMGPQPPGLPAGLPGYPHYNAFNMPQPPPQPPQPPPHPAHALLSHGAQAQAPHYGGLPQHPGGHAHASVLPPPGFALAGQVRGPAAAAPPAHAGRTAAPGGADSWEPLQPPPGYGAHGAGQAGGPVAGQGRWAPGRQAGQRAEPGTSPSQQPGHLNQLFADAAQRRQQQQQQQQPYGPAAGGSRGLGDVPPGYQPLSQAGAGRQQQQQQQQARWQRGSQPINFDAVD